MRNLFVIGIIFIVFSGCDEKRPPRGILTQDQMSSVLWDMFQAQGWARHVALKDSLSSVAVETKALNNKVLEIHNLSQQDFLKSYHWYLKHPDIFKVLLDSLYARKSKLNEPLLKKEESGNHGKPLPAIKMKRP